MILYSRLQLHFSALLLPFAVSLPTFPRCFFPASDLHELSRTFSAGHQHAQCHAINAIWYLCKSHKSNERGLMCLFPHNCGRQGQNDDDLEPTQSWFTCVCRSQSSLAHVNRMVLSLLKSWFGQMFAKSRTQNWNLSGYNYFSTKQVGLTESWTPPINSEKTPSNHHFHGESDRAPQRHHTANEILWDSETYRWWLTGQPVTVSNSYAFFSDTA